MATHNSSAQFIAGGPVKRRLIHSRRLLWRIDAAFWGNDKQLRNDDLPPLMRILMEGPEPPDDFISNGCSYSPDRVLGCDLRPAGHFHDYAYRLVRTEKERKEADYAFYRNLRRCGLPAWLARRYFYRVRAWGLQLCEYGGDHSQRPTGREWLKLFFTRYWEW